MLKHERIRVTSAWEAAFRCDWNSDWNSAHFHVESSPFRK